VNEPRDVKKQYPVIRIVILRRPYDWRNETRLVDWEQEGWF